MPSSMLYTDQLVLYKMVVCDAILCLHVTKFTLPNNISSNLFYSLQQAQTELLGMMENPTSSSLMDVDEMPTAVPAIAEAVEENTNRRTKEDEWYHYGPDMNQKKRFLFCEHCSYKTLERPGLIGHLKMVHRFVTTAITPSPDVSQSQRADALISINAPPSTTESGGKIEGIVKNDDCCSLCSFETKNKKSLRHHMLLHSKKSAFQCRLCSYSVGGNGNLSRHLKNHHLGKERNPKQVFF